MHLCIVALWHCKIARVYFFLTKRCVLLHFLDALYVVSFRVDCVVLLRCVIVWIRLRLFECETFVKWSTSMSFLVMYML